MDFWSTKGPSVPTETFHHSGPPGGCRGLNVMSKVPSQIEWPKEVQSPYSSMYIYIYNNIKCMIHCIYVGIDKNNTNCIYIYRFIYQ